MFDKLSIKFLETASYIAQYTNSSDKIEMNCCQKAVLSISMKNEGTSPAL